MAVNKYATFSFLVATFLIGGLIFIASNDYSLEENNNLELSSSVSNRNLIDEIFKEKKDKKDSPSDPEEKISNSSSFPAPDKIKAVYFTSWSASKEIHIEYIINLAKETDINAVVIDVKDFSGYVAYDTDIEELEKYGVEQKRIKDIDSLIESLSSSTVKDVLWRDDLGLAWIDPTAQDSWDYNIAIAKDALNHGFDEVNFDYVRFPSDGSLKDMVFPFWDKKKARHEVIGDFFSYLRKEMPEESLSVDLFGLSTVSYNDLGIGQIIEDAYINFDYVCPMIYPSHYSSGFLGYEKPAEYPYEVVERSVSVALERLKDDKNYRAKLRPWLQDFSLKTDYDAEMVKAQIKALKDVTGEDYAGYMLWNSYNVYTEEALSKD